MIKKQVLQYDFQKSINIAINTSKENKFKKIVLEGEKILFSDWLDLQTEQIIDLILTQVNHLISNTYDNYRFKAKIDKSYTYICIFNTENILNSMVLKVAGCMP